MDGGAPAAALRIAAGPPDEGSIGRVVRLAGHAISIGRSEDNDLVLVDQSALIARRHCAIEPVDGGWRLAVFGVNGVTLNGAWLGAGESRPLAAGDALRIGDYVLAVEAPT